MSGFRLDDPNLNDAERQETLKIAQSYYRLAHSYGAKLHAYPLLVVMAGLSGTGKTLLGRELAKRWEMLHVSSDVTRKGLAGTRKTTLSGHTGRCGTHSVET